MLHRTSHDSTHTGWNGSLQVPGRSLLCGVQPIAATSWDWERVQIIGFVLIVTSLLVFCVILLRNWRRERLSAEQRRVRHERELDELVHQHELRILDALKHGEERERERTDHDLKERLNSMLAGIREGFSHLEQRMDAQDERQEEQCQQVIGRLEEAMADMRRAGRASIRLLLDRFGLRTVLEDLRWSLEAPGSLRVALVTNGLGSRMDRNSQIGLYHLVHDAVDSALGHDGVDQLNIQLTREQRKVILTLQDNGSARREGHRPSEEGRRRLESRISRAHGSFRSEELPGGGHTLKVEIPDPA